MQNGNSTGVPIGDPTEVSGTTATAAANGGERESQWDPSIRVAGDSSKAHGTGCYTDERAADAVSKARTTRGFRT